MYLHFIVKEKKLGLEKLYTQIALPDFKHIMMKYVNCKGNENPQINPQFLVTWHAFKVTLE